MVNKELRALIRAIEATGQYDVVITRRQHVLVFVRETGEYVTTFAGTPSDWRGWRNSMSPLKRRGFQWPPRP